MRGEFVANYQPFEILHLKAGYKGELNNRRDNPSEVFTAAAGYADGTYIPGYAQENRLRQDIKHILNAAAAVELPFELSSRPTTRDCRQPRRFRQLAHAPTTRLRPSPCCRRRICT